MSITIIIDGSDRRTNQRLIELLLFNIQHAAGELKENIDILTAKMEVNYEKGFELECSVSSDGSIEQ